MGAKRLNLSIPNTPEFRSDVAEILKLVQAIDENNSAKPWIANLLREAMSGEGEDLEKQFTTQEAADLLQVSRSHLLRVIDGGRLPYILIGKHKRIKLGELLKYKKSCERQEKALSEMTRLGEEIEDGD